MKKFGLIILASLFFTACGGAGAVSKLTGDGKPQIGDTVVYKSGPINYNEGKVEKIEGGKYEIRSGSNIAKADSADVYALPKADAKAEVKTGDIVAAFSNDIYWTGSEVKNVTADLVEVEKASGGKLNVAHDKIIKVSPAAVADIRQKIDAKAFENLGITKKPILPASWKPKAGEKVAAQWSFGSWHVAIIKHVNANNVDIDWQNGWNDGTVSKDKIAPYPTAGNAIPKVEDYVIIKPLSDNGDWKFAVVTGVSGQQIDVKLADGKTQKLKVEDFIAMS